MTNDMKEYCTPKFKDNIKHAGWIDSKQVYSLFLASDLAIFPGTHSVLWEQSISCGLPGIFKDWDGGFNHIDCKGNVILLEDIKQDTLKKEILDLLNNYSKFIAMRNIAESNNVRDKFLYINIAKKAINMK